jgi:charged multivesicular body protein 4A/B
MSGVFGKVFGKSKVQSQATALASIDKLNEVNRSIHLLRRHS